MQVPRVHLQSPIEDRGVTSLQPGNPYQVIDRVVPTGGVEDQKPARAKGRPKRAQHRFRFG